MKKILIIDDCIYTQEILDAELRRAGYEILHALTGEDGIEQIKLCPDLILLDLRLTYMDGYETCKKIKEITNVPVIMMTAFYGGEEEKRSLEVGANTCLVKPLDYNELLANIKQYL